MEQMVNLIGSDPSDTIDIGHENYLNVDAIVTTSSLPPLVLPGGYVPKIPNPMPTGPHPMMERAFAAHENKLAQYNGTLGIPTPGTPTPKLIAARPRQRSSMLFIAEMIVMFFVFIVQLILFAPINLIKVLSSRPNTHTKLPRFEATYGEPVRVARTTPSPLKAFTDGLMRPITISGIGIWFSVTGILAVMQTYGLIAL